MKKIAAGIAAAALILTLSTASAFAAGRGYRGNFLDENGDGICDNRGTALCEGRSGCSFTDENGDGICDNYSKENCRRNDGAGWRRGCCR